MMIIYAYWYKSDGIKAVILVMIFDVCHVCASIRTNDGFLRMYTHTHAQSTYISFLHIHTHTHTYDSNDKIAL